MELDETVILTINNGTGYDPATGGAETATGAIDNDDSTTVNVSNVALKEGHASFAPNTVAFTFNVTLDNPIDTALTVSMNTAGGTAASGVDFTAVAGGMVTIPADTTGPQMISVTVTGDDTQEHPSEAFTIAASAPMATGREASVTIDGGSTGTGTIQNDDFNTTTTITDGNDPSENGEMFNVTASTTVNVGALAGMSPPVGSTRGARRHDGPRPPTRRRPLAINQNISLGAPLRDATLTGDYPAAVVDGGNNQYLTSSATTMHVVNNVPTFALTTSPLTVNGVLNTFNGPNSVVQSAPAAPEMFTVTVGGGGWVESIDADRFKGIANANAEDAQTVRFDVQITGITGNNGMNPFTTGGQPAVVDSAGAGFADQALTFTTRPGVAAIVDLTIRAIDDGVDLATTPPLSSVGVGEQASATQSFKISIYSVQPFLGDVLMADRGSRVFTGSVLLMHTNPPPPMMGPAKFPRQNLITDTMVDPYDLAIQTNTLGGQTLLEYLVIDYETVVSAKGRGAQGLYGINSVSLTRRLITTGGNFSVPVAVDVLPNSTAAGANEGMIVVGDSGFSDADPGKIVLVDSTSGAQSLLTQGGDLYWLTSMTVAPEGSPNEGMIYASDIGTVLGKTANKNVRPRKILQIHPQTGAQTVLAATTNDFVIPITNGMITNMFFPVGLAVDIPTGDLLVADAYTSTIWRLDPAMADADPAADPHPLSVYAMDPSLKQPTHLAIQGSIDNGFVFVSDAPQDALAGAIFLHRIDATGAPAGLPAAPYSPMIFTQDGFMAEPRGLAIIPTDPLTGN